MNNEKKKTATEIIKINIEIRNSYEKRPNHYSLNCGVFFFCFLDLELQSCASPPFPPE